MYLNNKGYSLIEMLVVIFILLVILNVAMVLGRSFNNAVNLENAVKTVDSKIKTAKARSIGALNDTNYGVHFDTNRVVVFLGNTYTNGLATNETSNLPDNIEIYNISLAGGGSDMVFTRLVGTTINSGSIGIRVKNDTSKTAQITINSEGQTTLGSFGTSISSPITNERHVHFALGWNIQNASTLRLEWVDGFGVPIITNDVTAATQFNADKSVFNWEGTTTVNGVDQTLRVHSWLDGGSNTVLCVMRDQTENEKLNIYFIDGATKKIADYTYDSLNDTVTVVADPTYGGTMTVE